MLNCFLDVKSAFDRVIRLLLIFKLCSEYKIGGSFLELVRQMNDNTIVYFLSNNRRMYFDVCEGLREGGVSSPFLYCLFKNSLIKELQLIDTRIFPEYNVNMSGIFFADDIFIPALDGPTMQKLIKVCHEFGRKWHLSFGVNKCNVVTQTEPRDVHTNSSGGHSFEFGPLKIDISKGPYCYLGSEDEGLLTISTHFIKRKTKSFNSVLRGLMYLKNKCGGFSLNTVRSLFQIFLRPLITSCVVEKYFSKSNYSYFMRLEVSALKSLAGLEKYTKSESVYVILGLQSYTHFMYRLKIRFYFRLLYATGTLAHTFFTIDNDLFINGFKQTFCEEISKIFEVLRTTITLSPQENDILKVTKTGQLDLKKSYSMLDPVMRKFSKFVLRMSIVNSSSGQSSRLAKLSGLLSPGFLFQLCDDTTFNKYRRCYVKILLGASWITPFNASKPPLHCVISVRKLHHPCLTSCFVVQKPRNVVPNFDHVLS